MSILQQNEFNKSYSDFWNWFQTNEQHFFKTVQSRKDIEQNIFDKLSPKLNEIKEGFFFLIGMYDDDTAELVFTADGNISNIVFVEELVQAAPQIKGWKFTASKPALTNDDLSIEMAGHTFNAKTLYFYVNETAGYPDEIDITIVHNDLTDSNEDAITSGIHIFLDNYLGELDFLNNIDNLEICNTKNAGQDLIPVLKLRDFITWRQKEFIEKYDGVRYNTEEDSYSMFESELENGNALLAVINTELLNWDSKASHPWIILLTLRYDGSNNNGMPESDDYELLNTIEEQIIEQLPDAEGYLNIGRQTADGEREIYFACRDFRIPSKVLHQVAQQYADSFEIAYEIYKDKYWRSFEHFMTT